MSIAPVNNWESIVDGGGRLTFEGQQILVDLVAAAIADVVWGEIVGDLTDQSDVQSALNGKQPLSAILTATTASFTTALNDKLDEAVTSDDVTILEVLTQAEYDVLTPDSQTLYFITG